MAKNRITSGSKVSRLVLIGGSTGSIDVLTRLIPALKTPLPFPVVIVIHRKNTADSSLVQVLGLKTTLPVREVEDKDPLLPGVIYLAPADYHLLFEPDGSFALDDSEKVNFSRPAIDVTFESAADVFGPATVAVLLSGANADGVLGLRAVRDAGGLTLAQEPDTAQVGYMPLQAIQAGVVNQVLDVPGIIAFINALGPTPSDQS